MGRTAERHLPELHSDRGMRDVSVDISIEASDEERDALVMTMLQRHVPLSLLCDLTAKAAPRSAEILAEEGLPADTWWTR